MKITKFLAVFLIFLFQVSAKAQEIKKELDIKKSYIKWIGKKVLGSHEGILNFKNGFLTLKNQRVVAGNFVVNMESLLVTDLEGESKMHLEKHLKNEDFFGTDKHKEAILKIKKSKGKKILADLTIKNITKPLEFSMNFENKKQAFVKTKIDRTLYGIRYKSKSFFGNLGDKAIYDEFEIQVYLFFK